MSALPSRQFWMVYGIGQRAPSYQHDTLMQAKAEAARLARLHPGIAFVVLQAVSAVVKDELRSITLTSKEAVDDGIPF